MAIESHHRIASFMESPTSASTADQTRSSSTRLWVTSASLFVRTGTSAPSRRPKAQANPGSLRKFDLSDGVYVGGILNGTPTQYVESTATGINIVDKNGNQIQMLPGSVNIVTTSFTVNGIPVTIP